MNKDIIKETLYIIIAIMLGIFAVKFVIWLLPIILIAILQWICLKEMDFYNVIT